MDAEIKKAFESRSDGYRWQRIREVLAWVDGWEDGETFYEAAIKELREIVTMQGEAWQASRAEPMAVIKELIAALTNSNIELHTAWENEPSVIGKEMIALRRISNHDVISKANELLAKEGL